MMPNYDLTSRIALHLDRHLVFPLLEFLQERQLYADEEILKAKTDLLSKTNMVDYAIDIHRSLHHTDTVPQGPFPLSSLVLFSYYIFLLSLSIATLAVWPKDFHFWCCSIALISSFLFFMPFIVFRVLPILRDRYVL